MTEIIEDSEAEKLNQKNSANTSAERTALLPGPRGHATGGKYARNVTEN